MPMMRATRAREDDEDEYERPTKRTKLSDAATLESEDEYHCNSEPSPCCYAFPCICPAGLQHPWAVDSMDSGYNSNVSSPSETDRNTSRRLSSDDYPTPRELEADRARRAHKKKKDRKHRRDKKEKSKTRTVIYDKDGLQVMPHVKLERPKRKYNWSIWFDGYNDEADFLKRKGIEIRQQNQEGKASKKRHTPAPEPTKADDRETKDEFERWQYMTEHGFKSKPCPKIYLPGYWRRVADDSKELDFLKDSAKEHYAAQSGDRWWQMFDYAEGFINKAEQIGWEKHIHDNRERARRSVWHNKKFFQHKESCKSANPFHKSRLREMKSNEARESTQPRTSHLRWQVKDGFKSGLAAAAVSVDDFEAIENESEAETVIEGGEEGDSDSESLSGESDKDADE
ncbi:uncharacterized protein LY89DRAFT_665541 [Mollisia scopiformis]|uniref:Uncharacterized protein n=1 Tax=Mollisia scopiformis TaxID=149040 RepID=A0A194XMS9_MOLSC|nr:uncharacterized protein LY89DRAFT_665541 [Mollisia scopiformis]KUJ21082.1 hypothetical protein LY89DRAFT_665541 [Mollisia scopiformis]